MPSLASMQFRSVLTLITGLTILCGACRAPAPEAEIRQDIKYLALFSSPALTTQDDDKRLSAAFQSKYKSRVILLRPVTGIASLGQLNAKVSLMAVLKINHLREARAVCREIEQAMAGGALLSLMPFLETHGSQDNFSGSYFYLTLEHRAAAFLRLSTQGKNEIFRNESDDLARDRNILSYFAGATLSDSPYHSLHILGFSGLAETQYQTIDGLYQRSLRKLEAADSLIAEKIR